MRVFKQRMLHCILLIKNDYERKTKYNRPFENIYIYPSRPDPRRREKINLNFHFHTSLWCFKRFYEDLHKAFIKPFEAPQSRVKIKV